MNYDNYHPNFRRRKRELLKQKNYKCERCGTTHRSISYNRKGQPYTVFLHAAHAFHEEKMQPNAHLILLCNRCHYFFDHPREDQQGIADWEFIGTVAKNAIEAESRMIEQQKEQTIGKEPMREDCYA